ncbi:hypothetical protein KSC_110150 [Ktedonobacter sp. SOSP1-52]|nr:hypothetical protein KSC_110150 [Ktedonobacter sp. SOSP1-52]
MLFCLVPGAIDFEQLAKAPDGNGLLLLACMFNDGMPLLYRYFVDSGGLRKARVIITRFYSEFKERNTLIFYRTPAKSSQSHPDVEDALKS